MPSHNRLNRLIRVGVCAAVVLFWACGGDDEDTSCGAPKTHSILDALGNCVCEAGYDWRNSSASADFTCLPTGVPIGVTVECDEGYRLQGGYCVPECSPDCADRQCGDDGCGGSCGACETEMVCDPDGHCA